MPAHTRAEERDMILSPMKWPLLYLPLKRRTDHGYQTAFLAADLSVDTLDATKPIDIRVGNIMHPIADQRILTYTDVDALLDDGWVVD